MFEEIDKRFEEILNIAKQNDLSTEIIKKAYNKAKDLHKFQKRKDGKPYISHPVEVALILAQLGFDENVISGALLHDTIEDCEYLPQQLKQDFNTVIFNLVDCVSAIDKTKYVFNNDDIYDDPNFVKTSAEDQSFKKLITLGKNNPCGFAIKFADRVHNLRTIGIFDYSKQLEKVRETEKWVLPIAKALKSEFFYRTIKNEYFKIENREHGKQFFDHFNIYHNSNKKHIDDLLENLEDSFLKSSIKNIKIKNVYEYKVFEDLTRIYKKLDIARISQGQILKVANYNIFLLYNNTTHKKAISEVMNILSEKTDLKIIDAKIGNFTSKMYFQAEDSLKNKYNIYVLSGKDYSALEVGTLDGQNLDKLDEDNINTLDVELMRIKTRSGEVIYMQKNSTALDFAFKIHKDIGFSFKYALINNGSTKFPPYTKLNEGDRVEIITGGSENGKIKNNAQIRWLAYVNTELSKKILIKYFEKVRRIN